MNLIADIQKIQNYLKVEDFKTVVNKGEKLIEKNPNNPFLYNLVGLALHGSGNFMIAIDRYKKAIDLDPNFLPAKNNLANSYKSIGNFEKAEFFYKSVLESKPDYIQALNNYANLKTLIFDYPSAIDLFEQALKINKEDSRILFALANAYHAIGETKKTKEIIENILLKNPKHASCHKLLSSLVNYSENETNLNQMKDLILDKDLSDGQIVDLSFALGKAYEDIKQYENSFLYLQKANQLKKKNNNYNLKSDEIFFESIKNAFKNFNFDVNKENFDKRVPIFICGMPRSGTTLIEQIIASHHDVFGSGELVYIQSIIKKNLIFEKKFSNEKLNQEFENHSNYINKEYFKMIDFHNFKSNHFTDKAPQNFRWLGVIKIFFPNSKIIYCKRNAKDNCLSIYKNYFVNTKLNFAYNLDEIVDFYNLYIDLMKHWREILPNFVIDIEYEKLIKNPETEIKHILNKCNLKWNKECLKFYNNKRPIKTASDTQARKKIYKHSINSWMRFEKYLKESFQKLPD